VSTVAATGTGLYADVVGQERAVAHLQSAAKAPVHAYLFVGPPGSGKRAAAMSFAASLLCLDGGCGACSICQRVLHGSHLDLVVAERAGPFISVEQAKNIGRMAVRSPAEGSRKVLVLVDFHLVHDAAPVLLKSIEEPAPGTVFVILADYVPPELVTIASRSVIVEFDLLSEARIAGELEAGGVSAPVAAEAARASGGRLDRARMLAGDPEVGARRRAWESVPGRLDGTGATAAILAAELLAMVSGAGAEALAARQARDVAGIEERAALTGERGAGRKELEDRHKREQRRLRTDELRLGLSTLVAAYRDRAAGGGPDARHALEAAAAVEAAMEALIRNPNEGLLLQALMVRLTPR
jgi:DNA polymerase-3 subunit delta'